MPRPSHRSASPPSRRDDLKQVTVEGSESGVHSGRLSALPDGRGTAFVAESPFAPGESVSVQVELASAAAGAAAGAPGAEQIAFTFTVATSQVSTTTPSTRVARRRPPRRRRTRAPSATGGTTTTTSQRRRRRAFTRRPTSSRRSSPSPHPDADPGSGYVFVDSQFAPQNGPMILDGQGNLVWFDPLPNNDWAMDVRVQSYAGQAGAHLVAGAGTRLRSRAGGGRDRRQLPISPSPPSTPPRDTAPTCTSSCSPPGTPRS